MRRIAHRSARSGLAKLTKTAGQRRLAWLARLAITALVLGLLFSRISFDQVLQGLGGLRSPVLAVILANFLLIRFLVAQQMSLGLRALRLSFSIWELFRINLIAGFFSLLLPGDLVAGGYTWYRLSRPTGQVAPAGLLLVYLRLLNTATLLGLGLVGMGFDSRLVVGYGRLGLVAMLLGTGLMAVPFFSPRAMDWLEAQPATLALKQRLPARIVRPMQMAWQSIRDFHQLANLRSLLVLLGLALLAQALGVLNLALLAHAVGVNLSLAALTWVRTVFTVVQMIPLSYAGLGLREATLVVLLQAYDVPQASALALSLAVFAMIVFGGLLGGLAQVYELARSERSQNQASTEAQVDSLG
jgi:uncharacterized membrane protein YbhN (UPF0104 family)